MSEKENHADRRNEDTLEEQGSGNTETAAADGTATPEAQEPDAAQGEMEAVRAENAQLRDQLLRKVAEFENYKRRTRDEKDLLMKYGAEGIILDLLPVIDDFQRSLSSGKEHSDFESMYKGVEIIYGKLMRVLENRGLRPIEAVGKPFDVDFHHAILQIPSSDVSPGTVLDVAEAGYILYDKVIRHAKVTVSREDETESPEART